MDKHVLLLMCIGLVRGQTSESNGNCPGYTTIHNNIYGVDAVPVQQVVDQGTSVRQGRPGKVGPTGMKGETGASGSKGYKGEKGEPDRSVTEELRLVKDELSSLQRKLDIVLFPPKSCDYINGTASGSGYYVISPNPGIIEPFTVFCNFSTSITETVVGHDSLDEIEVDHCEQPRCYKRRVQYGATMRQLESLIAVSSECRQFIKFRCVAVLLALNAHGTSYSAWLSRDGMPMTYWGGATSRRDHYCSCGETGSCVDQTKNCNCDRNTPPETADEGFLTDKDTLPVTGLQFGDNGDPGEMAWHTLGPIICSGRNM